jgi:hypothetical protein
LPDGALYDTSERYTGAYEGITMDVILSTEEQASTYINRHWLAIDRVTQDRIRFSITMIALLLVMSAAIYMVAILLMNPDAAIDATYAIVALCIAAAILGFAILVESQISRARAKQVVADCIGDFEPEPTSDEIASLRELDELLCEQEPYFRVQLAIALRDKARHFPIRTSDIDGIRTVLQTGDNPQHGEPNPQVRHLNKIIKGLDNGCV